MTRFTLPLSGKPPAPRRVRVALVGLGPIGIAVGRALAARDDRTVAAAVDPAPDLAGRPLTELLGNGVGGRLRVLPNLDGLPAAAEVAVHATGSTLHEVLPGIEALLSRGLHVVSTCESLFFPSPADRREAARLDAWARKCGRVVTAGGVNPGFAMDAWPLMLATAMSRVDAVEASRVLDVSRRRLQLQRKVCVGEDPGTVRDLIRNGVAGHVGLLNSALFLAGRFGWPVDRAVRSQEVVVAPRDLDGPVPVARGRTAGLTETLRLYEGRKPRVTLRLVMAVGASPAEDRVRLRGEPPLEAVVVGGVPGDSGTVGEIVNLVSRLDGAPPGLRSVGELPLPFFPRPR